jgi:hypothetical protein
VTGKVNAKDRHINAHQRISDLLKALNLGNPGDK